ncbi:hypothetical protein BBJ28_00013817 [Nothophytophthora sp. Chile5]|nr:hypothetical protein BBJ28_00013817 [Nothophytophthora sp. Chile5]
MCDVAKGRQAQHRPQSGWRPAQALDPASTFSACYAQRLESSKETPYNATPAPIEMGATKGASSRRDELRSGAFPNHVAAVRAELLQVDTRQAPRSRQQRIRLDYSTMAPKKSTKAQEDGISENEVRSLLIGKDGNLTRDFEAVLTRLFISFLEQPTDKSLTLEKLKDFSKICNDGKPFSDEEIKEIQTYFQCDENKGLTLKGFKDMYHTQSSAEPMETWRDMKKLGCVSL